jgi:hypothetical protein
MPREHHEDGRNRATETQTRTPPHHQSSQSKHKRKQRSRHREVADEVAEGKGEGEEANQTMHAPRNQMLLHLSLCPRLYNKQRIVVEEVDVAARGAAEEEVVQSDSHSAWLLVVANSADS